MRRPSPALLLSVAALVIALGGTAVAAKKYVITSTKQISPKVLQQLRGRTGPIGPVGLPGPRGTDGAAGQPGVEGPPGPSSVVSVTRADIVSFSGGSATELTALPPGDWLVVGSLTASGQETLMCQVEGQAGSEIGLTGSASQLTTSAALTLAAPTNVRLLCDPSNGDHPTLRSIRLYAIRTGELVKRSVD
jgi:hypothetical protein